MTSWQLARPARPSRDGGPSRDLKREIQDLAFRMARANYPSELIYAALNGLRSGWCAHVPDASRSPQPAADLVPSATSRKSARRPGRGGRPSQERRAARRFEARAKQLAAEEAARNKVAAEKEAAHRKAQAAAVKEAAQKKVTEESEVARKASEEVKASPFKGGIYSDGWLKKIQVTEVAHTITPWAAEAKADGRLGRTSQQEFLDSTAQQLLVHSPEVSQELLDMDDARRLQIIGDAEALVCKALGVVRLYAAAQPAPMDGQKRGRRNRK